MSNNFWFEYIIFQLSRSGARLLNLKIIGIFASGFLLVGVASNLEDDSAERDVENCRTTFEQSGIPPEEHKWMPNSKVLEVCGFVPDGMRKINYAWQRQKHSERPKNTAERLDQIFDCSAKFENQGKPEDYIYKATKPEIVKNCEVVPAYLE